MMPPTYLRFEGSGHGAYDEHKAETRQVMKEFFSRVSLPAF